MKADKAPKKMSRPLPKKFNISKHKKIIESLSENMDEIKFEKLCEPIVFDILENYEGFEEIEKGPEIRGTPFDFLGCKEGNPFIIEFKGSLNRFNSPGETQKRRMQEILKHIKGLNIALLQVKLKKAEYRVFYSEDMNILFNGGKAPIKPIVDWIKKRL